MYTERMVANSWRRSAAGTGATTGVHPSITLSFMPMSHVMGRGMLYGTLGIGGTAYFAAQERPFDVPGRPRAGSAHPAELRAADLGHDLRRLQSELDRAIVDGPAGGAAAECACRRLLGGRYVIGDDGLGPDVPRDEGLRRVAARHAPDRRLRLDRGRRGLRRRADSASAGDRLQARRRARPRATSAPTGRTRAANCLSRPPPCSPATTSGPK